MNQRNVFGRTRKTPPISDVEYIVKSDPAGQGLDRQVANRLSLGIHTKDDYKAYLKTEHWAKVREAAFEHYGRRCMLCDTKERLQVHHRPKGYKHLFNEDIRRHVVVICAGDHAHHHRRRRG